FWGCGLQPFPRPRGLKDVPAIGLARSAFPSRALDMKKADPPNGFCGRNAGLETQIATCYLPCPIPPPSYISQALSIASVRITANAPSRRHPIHETVSPNLTVLSLLT